MVNETVHDSMVNGQNYQAFEQICNYTGGAYQFFIDYENWMKSYGVAGWCKHWSRMAKPYIYRK